MDFTNNYLYLLALRINTKTKKALDYIRSSFRFYSNPAFKKADLALLKAYIGVNAYALSRLYLEEKGESTIYAYGETPIMTLERICKRCRLASSDTIFELGCGRGRACFWLALVLKAKVIGIDFVPEFIEKAEKVRKEENLKRLQFLSEDFLDSNLSQATVIYLHGSCMKDEDIERLNQKLVQLKSGLKVITVSFSMQEYDRGDHWDVHDVFQENFSWGSTDVYLQILK
jgi:SAM-dependent methyltransferase